MDRRQHDRLARPGRRQSDRRAPAADSRRALLVGPDEGWRLLTVYLFEEAGYAVYAAADQRQAVAFSTRLLPDVVVVQMETPDTLDILARLSEGSSTYDIPVVVLTPSLQSTEARRAREAGGVALLAHSAEGEVLVGEVDTLIAAAPRAQRALKRRLLDIKELARTTRRTAMGKGVCATDRPSAGRHIGGRRAGPLHRSEPGGDDAHGLLPSAADDHLGVPNGFRWWAGVRRTLAGLSSESALCMEDHDHQPSRRGRGGPRGRRGDHAWLSSGGVCPRVNFAQPDDRTV